MLGVAMMFPRVQDRLERPFSRLGRRQVDGEHGGFALGLALGAVYVPCAGPVLAAITVAGATARIGLRTVALTVAFAIGAAIPLLIFALVGRGVTERVRAFRDRQPGVRVVAGVVVIGLAVALTFNITDALQRTVPDYTASLNKALDKSGAANSSRRPRASRGRSALRNRHIRQLLTATSQGVTLPAPTDVADTTPTNAEQTPEAYLGSTRQNSNANSQYGVLANGTTSYTYPTLLPPNGFALTGIWTVADESLTAGRGAELQLNFDASNVYLDVGGTGNITATVKGKTTVHPVSGAPNIYTVFHGSAPQQATITIRLSAGLTAYSFTFG